MTAENTLALEVGGNSYQGWLSATVHRSIEQAAANFALTLTASWPGESNPIRIHPGDRCEILIGDDYVLTGWIDTVDIGHSGGDHTIAVAGRSLTADLVDCSAAPGQMLNRTLPQIATALSNPYNINVLDEVGLTDTIKRFAPDTGETIFACIERLARDQSVLVTDDTTGNLVLTRVGTMSGPDLTHPGNILQSRLACDMSRRYTEYRIKGQSAGDDQNWGEMVAQSESAITDSGIARYRPLILRAERQANNAICKRRAVWEAVTRAGRSAQVDITVQGWRDVDGNLYEVNRVCRVVDPVIGVDADLLVVSVEFTLDEAGMLTTLMLAPPGAYEPTPPDSRATAITVGIGPWAGVGS